MDGGLFGENIF